MSDWMPLQAERDSNAVVEINARVDRQLRCFDVLLALFVLSLLALPLALGEATKTVPFVQDGEKSYRFTVRWGIETESDDTEGRVTATSDLRPGPDQIEAALPRFIGTAQLQMIR